MGTIEIDSGAELPFHVLSEIPSLGRFRNYTRQNDCSADFATYVVRARRIDDGTRFAAARLLQRGSVSQGVLGMNRSVEPSQLESGEKPAMISTPTLSEPTASTMPAVPENAVRDLVQVFRMLADETRMRILFFLSRAGELHVRALCELLGQSQPAVSHHLALMKHDELIELRREGKHNFYRIVPQRFEQALGLLFDNVPSEDRRIRFEDHVLSYDAK